MPFLERTGQPTLHYEIDDYTEASASRPGISALLPHVPAVAEAGVPGYEFSSWIGLLAPAATPPDTVAAVNGYWIRALRSPDIVARFSADGSEIIASSPVQFRKVIRTKWRAGQSRESAGLQE